MKPKKNRYKGSFNLHGEVITIYRYAISEAQAFNLMTRKIAKDVGVTHARIKYFFNGAVDNFSIEKLG